MSVTDSTHHINEAILYQALMISTISVKRFFEESPQKVWNIFVCL